MKIIRKKSLVKNKAGFSLVEILVYVFILSLVLAVVTSSLFSVAKSYRVLRSVASIDTTAQVALDMMAREIRNSIAISDTDSIFNSSPGKISLITTNDTGSPMVMEFYLDSETIFVEEESVLVGPLSASSARVSGLVFRKIITDESHAIKIEMTVESGQGESFRTKKFYSTAVLRGTYAP